ncbi:TasA family protein [Cytobacillus gottheilii]|uniref:TasA family protein n=1 Tax=Cytobacillus gottheilii TaxID=859144 RepID=UPI0009BAE7F8|nr:TasA family protein [Cytobacillus gottheilii]
MNNQGLLAKPKILFILIVFMLSIGIGGFPVHAEDKEVDIQTDPSGYLFQVDNLKPGDWMPRNITIKNNGLMDFKYIARIGEKKSVKGLFEELEFLVKKESHILYEGKLKDFTGFSPRELASGTEETLFLQVKVPERLGNEFQGSSAEVEIIFLAERIGDSTPTDPGEGPDPTDPGEDPDPTVPNDEQPAQDIVVSPEVVNKLPNTATNHHNIIIAGLLATIGGGFLLLIYIRKIRNAG